MKVGAIIQARVGSTRLPGKVLMDLGGKTVLQRVVERVQQIRSVDTVIVATSDRPENLTIEDAGAPVYRHPGEENDVLGRYYRVAADNDLDVIMRITADCPLIDPVVCEKVLLKYLLSLKGSPLDYVSNTQPPTFPDGLDCEVFSYSALEWTDMQVTNSYYREHVTPALYDVKYDGGFQSGTVFNDTDLSYHRWTLDTVEDLEWIRGVYQLFGDRPFYMEDVLDAIEDGRLTARTLPRK